MTTEKPTKPPSKAAFFIKIKYILAFALLSLISYVYILTFEPVQRSLIYVAWVKFPFYANYDKPEEYGYAPYKVRNLVLKTSDGATLGAYHVLPHSVYEDYVEKYGFSEPIPDHVYDDALKDPSKLTMLHFHGNLGTRLTPHRVRLGSSVTTQLDYNFVILDYRGFADSEPSPEPSEDGLVTDARRIWDWLTIEKQVLPSQIGINGQSLGTGVAAKLIGNELAKEDIQPRALMLIAPYTSIPELLETFRIGRLIPVIGFLKSVPFYNELVDYFLTTKFLTTEYVKNIKCPILMVHSLDDPVIPVSHSDDLFEYIYRLNINDEASKIHQQKLANFGSLQSFSRNHLHSANDNDTDKDNVETELLESSKTTTSSLSFASSFFSSMYPNSKKDTDKPQKDDDVYYLRVTHGSHSSIQYTETTMYVMKLIMEL